VGGKTSTSTSQVQIPPEVLARYNSVNATAQNVAQTPFQQYSTNPNAFVAPLTPTQEAGVANTNTAAGMAQPYFGAATGFALAGAQPVNPAALDTSKYMNPYLQTVLGSTEAMVNQQNQQAQAGQTGNAINQGYFGGDRSGIAQAVLSGQQELAGGQLYSGIASDAYQQALAAAQQQQGVGLAAAQANRAATQQTGETLAGLGAGAQSAALAGAQAQLGAGQVEQQTQQAGDTALYNQFLQQQSYPFQTAQFLANIAEGTGALSGSTTATTQPQSIFSDERLKEDMEPIGKGFDGANIYRFRYKDDPHNITRIGFSAQEMERHHPEAVHNVGGFKAVEQHAATEEAARRGGFALAANDNSHEPARMARQGGGLSEWGSYPEGANPMVIAQLLQSQEGMYAPYSQQGLYGGPASSAPHGGSSYVPQANLPVGQLQVAHPAAPPQSAAHQAAEAAGDVSKLGSAAHNVHQGYDWLSNKFGGGGGFDPGEIGGPDEFIDPSALKDTAPPITGEANGGFIRAARQDGGETPYGGLGLNIPTGFGGAPHQLQTPGAPGAGKSGLSSALDTAGSAAGDINNLAKAGQTVGKGIDWLSNLASAVPFAEGGFARAHRDLGGISDPQNDIPDQPVGPGLNIPNVAQQHQLAVAKPPSQGGGNNTMSDIMDVAKIAAMFAARGGRIGRQDGGDVLPLFDPNGPDQPPPQPPRPRPTTQGPADQLGETLALQNPAAAVGAHLAQLISQGVGDFSKSAEANVAAGMRGAPPPAAAPPTAVPPKPAATSPPTGGPSAPQTGRGFAPAARHAQPHVVAPAAPSMATAAVMPPPVSADSPPSATMVPPDTSQPSLAPGFAPGKIRHDTSDGSGGFGGIGNALGSAAEGLAGYDPKTGKWDTDQLMRLFSGVAAMGATPTVHPLFALSQGLGGYANAFYQQQQAKADIARTQAGTALTQQQIFNEMQQAVPPGLRAAGIQAEPGPGAANQKTIYDHTGAPWHYNVAAESIPGGAPGTPPGAPSAAAAAAAAPPAPATGAPPAPAGSGAAPPVRDPISRDDKTGSYSIAPGSVANDFVQKTYGLTAPAPGTSAVAARVLGQAQLAGNPRMQHLDEQEQASLDQLPSLQDTVNTHNQHMAIYGALASLPATGAAAPGAGFGQRQSAANAYVTARAVLKGFGVNLPDNASADQIIQAGQELDKLRGLAGPLMAGAAGQHSAHVSDIITAVMPGGQYQPEAARKVLSTMILQNQQAADRRNYVTSYIAQRGYAAGANEAFDQEFGPRYQAEARAMPAMMAKGPTGKSAVDVLRANPTPAMTKEFDGIYGVGSSRLWLGGG
jgi:hypothetical protein